MGIKILIPGPLTTVQDLGRTGYQKFGIAPSGALDRAALITANLLAGNPPGAAGLEMTLMGAKMEFTSPAVFAVTGGNFAPALNGAPVPMNAAVSAGPGDTLAFSFAKSGCRAYVAFAGGLDVPAAMGSRSTNLKCGIGGFLGRKLAAGDEIPFAPRPGGLPAPAGRSAAYAEPDQKEVTLRVVLGPQDDYFTETGLRTFLSKPYAVTNRSDRMGCALDGPAIEARSGVDIISDGIPLGAVQVPASGKPIVMLADRQTTGGYAKIATVVSADLPLFVQRKAGDIVRFRAVSMREAQNLRRRAERESRRFQKKMQTL